VRSAVLILQLASHETGTFVGLSHVRRVDSGRVIHVQTLRGYIRSTGQPYGLVRRSRRYTVRDSRKCSEYMFRLNLRSPGILRRVDL